LKEWQNSPAAASGEMQKQVLRNFCNT
jgi:hypothetical protein